MGNLRNLAGQALYDDSKSGGVIAHGATYTAPVHDLLGFNHVRAAALQTQAGSMVIQQSSDPTLATDVCVSSTTAISASTFGPSGDVALYRRYVRVTLSNTSGSTDTTSSFLSVVATIQ